SSLPTLADPVPDSLRAANPTVTGFLATVVTDPSFESTAASALVAELVDFAAHCRLDYAASLVAESVSVCPPSVEGECALSTDVLEDRQEEFQCFAAALPHLVSTLLAPEGYPDAPDILTPRSYAEAIEGPYSSQWQAAMDAEMASWKSTGTYVDEVPPPGANIVSGMWIFRVKRPPGSPPVFKARYVAQGFSQRQGVDYFQTFSPTPKMTTLRVLLHIAAQRDYELHSLDFSTAFLQGNLHEEIWLRRPPGFTGSFPPGTQWSLRRPVYGLRQAPREWHDTLRTTLAALGFAPSTADPSLFLRTDTLLPPFYILVYVDDLVFATADTAGLAHVKSELQKRHTCTDLGEMRSYLGLQITRDRAQRTITLTQSHMVQQVLQRFDFTYSSPQATPLSTRHSLSALPSDESVEPSGPYPELVGCLMYLMTCTRPDLAYPLSILARYVAPGRHRPEHMAAAKRVLRYLCSTSGLGLVLGGRSPVVLTGHADASWVDDLATQRSSQGYTFSLGSGSVSWRSTRSSSTDLGEPPRSPLVLYVDNKAMLALCHKHRLEHRTKHIALRYFLARELQQRGQLRLAYVASQANTADIFTKALQPCDHQRFCTMLGLFYHPTAPRVLPSQDVTFDESVPFYCLFPYRTAPLPPFLAPGPPPIEPLPPQGPSPSGVSDVDPLPGTVPVDFAVDLGAARGAASGVAASGGVASGGANPASAEPEGVEPGGAESEGTATWGAEPGGSETEGAGAGCAGAGSTGTGGAGVRGVGVGDPGVGGVGAGGTGAGGTGAGGAGAGGAGAGDPGVGGTGARGFGAGGARAGGAGAGVPGAGGAGAVDPGAGVAGDGGAAFGGTGAGGTVQRRPFFVPPHSRLCRHLTQSFARFLPDSPLPALSAYTEQTASFTEHREPEFCPALPVRAVGTGRRVRCPRPPPIPGTHVMALPRAANPAVSRLLATVVTDPSFESTAASAVVAKLVDFAAVCRTYVDAVPPSKVNIVDGMWILRGKQPPGSSPVFKACYVARGFSQRQGVDFFQTFYPTPKMTTLRVLLHVVAQGDYELHSLDLWWPVYSLRQAPREWHDTLRTTLAALGFAPSIADPSLFPRTHTSLPPFYVLVYVDDLVFATNDTEALALVKSELQKRHTCTDMGELRSYLGLQITWDRAQRTITLTESDMVHQVLQRFGFQFSSPQSTPLPTCGLFQSLSCPFIGTLWAASSAPLLRAAPPCRVASPGAEPRHPAELRRPTELRRPAEPRGPTEPHCPARAAPAVSAATAATAATAAMASPTVLTFYAEGRVDGVSLFDHTSGVSPAPTATVVSTVRSQWTTRDAVACLAVRSHLPSAERTHFGQYKTAKSLDDAVVARYSSPATAALSRLMLPYIFPDLAAFATVVDLITHLRTSDARYRAALPTEWVVKGVAVEVGVVAGVGASVAAVGVVEAAAAAVEAAAAVVEVAAVVELVEVEPRSVEALVVASASSSRVPVRPRRPSSFVSGTLGVGVLGVLVPALTFFAPAGTVGRRAGCHTQRSAAEVAHNVAIFDLDFDAFLAAMYAVTDSAEGDCYLSVPPDPGIEATALGASASAAPGSGESAAPSAGESALSGTAPTEALHTFTLDSGASRTFFRDSTMLMPLCRPVAVSLADPSGGPVLVHSSMVLPCPAAPSGLLSGLHLPSFSTNLVSGADLQDAWVDQFTHRGQRVM
ncbi:unnamed protein product, partial [Closterium sp. NIES-53]